MRHTSRWSARGEFEPGLYHLQVFAVGKWRTTHVVCRKPRRLSATEVAQAARLMWLNTGKPSDYPVIDQPVEG